MAKALSNPHSPEAKEMQLLSCAVEIAQEQQIPLKVAAAVLLAQQAKLPAGLAAALEVDASGCRLVASAELRTHTPPGVPRAPPLISGEHELLISLQGSEAERLALLKATLASARKLLDQSAVDLAPPLRRQLGSFSAALGVDVDWQKMNDEMLRDLTPERLVAVGVAAADVDNLYRAGLQAKLSGLIEEVNAAIAAGAPPPPPPLPACVVAAAFAEHERRAGHAAESEREALASLKLLIAEYELEAGRAGEGGVDLEQTDVHQIGIGQRGLELPPCLSQALDGMPASGAHAPTQAERLVLLKRLIAPHAAADTAQAAAFGMGCGTAGLPPPLLIALQAEFSARSPAGGPPPTTAELLELGKELADRSEFGERIGSQAARASMAARGSAAGAEASLSLPAPVLALEGNFDMKRGSVRQASIEEMSLRGGKRPETPRNDHVAFGGLVEATHDAQFDTAAARRLLEDAEALQRTRAYKA
jgi:hypothetical protein